MLIITASIVILAIIIWFYQNKTAKKIKKWQQALKLNIHQPIFNKLYCDVNGFNLSKMARLKQDTIAFIYGEIEFESFIALLSLCKPQVNTIFYDLGSGTGKAVIACAMVFNIQKSYGIELLVPLHKCAQKQQERLGQLESYRENAKKIVFIQGDFLQKSFVDGTIIFINAATFIAELWEQLSTHVEQVKPGTLIISTSKVLNSKRFILRKIVPVRMSWGIVNAFIQQRLSDI
ncbi:methyltransferase [Legionella sp. D16C41]|uniref:methyltransferase n=1 Tax=Legionella sp. D16C41 TaxID=3402688 RepID=UPI003AF8C3DB